MIVVEPPWLGDAGSFSVIRDQAEVVANFVDQNRMLRLVKETTCLGSNSARVAI